MVKKKCGHVWDDVVGYGLHCVICGVSGEKMRDALMGRKKE